MRNVQEEALRLHKEHQGKIEVVSKVPLKESKDLTLAYSPGVAAPCLAIKDDPEKIYDYTAKGNMVAVVTNGTAVLGLGNIGAGAGLPVMEGNIPVFHDDQHGTAIVVVSALINAFKLTGRDFTQVRFVVNGAGAAGQAITRLIHSMGAKDIVLCDTLGAIYEGRPDGMNPYKDEIAKITNPAHRAAPTIRTRSTTCSLSRASSAARSTCVQRKSTTRCAPPPPTPSPIS